MQKRCGDTAYMLAARVGIPSTLDLLVKQAQGSQRRMAEAGALHPRKQREQSSSDA